MSGYKPLKWEVEKMFSRKDPLDEETSVTLDMVRDEYKNLAILIHRYCRNTKETEKAIMDLRSSMIWALTDIADKETRT